MSVDKQWEDLLTPAVLQERLISTSLYMTAFEMLKESIVGRLRDFYCIGFADGELTISPQYEEKVLSLAKSPLYASLQWLVREEVIVEQDIEVFERLKKLRNTLAHELPSIVLTGRSVGLVEEMQCLMSLLRKVEVWWVVNVEIATDPSFDGVEVDSEGITPGPILMMQIMFDVIAGNESLKEYYKNSSGKS